MSNYQSIITWLETQSSVMQEMVAQYAAINTHTFNLAGLQELTNSLQNSFKIFDQAPEIFDLNPLQVINSQGNKEFRELGQAIKLSKRSHAPKQALLMI